MQQPLVFRHSLLITQVWEEVTKLFEYLKERYPAYSIKGKLEENETVGIYYFRGLTTSTVSATLSEERVEFTVVSEIPLSISWIFSKLELPIEDFQKEELCHFPHTTAVA